MRDVFHLLVNLSMGQLTEKEKAGITAMKAYFLQQLRPYLVQDPVWQRVGKYVEGTAPEDE
jgi:hypothetical protein